jgi:hypothetical protein
MGVYSLANVLLTHRFESNAKSRSRKKLGNIIRTTAAAASDKAFDLGAKEKIQSH